MRDYAREALTLTAGRARADLDSDRMLNLSLARVLEVVGEASNRVPKDVQALHARIPWLGLLELRNRLMKAGDCVNFDQLWQTVKEDTPPLVSELD